MAIAYFIPDQSKLLGGGAANNNNNNASHNNGQSPAGTPTAHQHQHQHPHPHQQPHHPQNAYAQPPPPTPPPQQHSNNFRANITIPLTAYSASGAHTVGCWDLITQIFCYALRFYHQSERRPTVIQISLEISSGNGSDTGPQSAATQQPTAGASPSASASERPTAIFSRATETPAATQADKGPKE